jgi:hypothetical protein
MQDNIIEAEALALHICKHFNSESGMVLFDFSAAFPSLSHQFIFAALAELGVPEWFLMALRKLYSKCTANILIGGCSDVCISIEAGIKQGCPASGSIFALVLDPFVRYLAFRLPRPLNSLGVFADDIVATMFNLFKGLRDLCPCFDLLAYAAGLRLNTKKTVIIPLGTTTTFATRRFLVESIPHWGNMLINKAGKLLGVLLGPGADDQRWVAATSKFWTRSRDAKATTGGFMQALSHYRIFAFPVLQHLMSYTMVPKSTQHMENLAVQGITRSPFNTFPSGSVNSLTDVGFRCEAPNLAITNLAALARTAITSDIFVAARTRHYSDNLPDEARLHPRNVVWFDTSVFAALLKAYEHIHAIPISIVDYSTTHLQAHLYAALRQRAQPGPWPSLLVRRGRRWFPEWCAEDAARTLRGIWRMSQLRPHPMLLCYLRVLLNGVPTAARMQGSDQACLLCGWPTGDRIEHLVQCTALSPFLVRHCPHLCLHQGPVMRHQALCLVAPNMSDDLIADVCLYACVIFDVHCKLRHGSISDPLALAEARLRQLQTRHVSLR